MHVYSHVTLSSLDRSKFLAHCLYMYAYTCQPVITACTTYIHVHQGVVILIIIVILDSLVAQFSPLLYISLIIYNSKPSISMIAIATVSKSTGGPSLLLSYRHATAFFPLYSIWVRALYADGPPLIVNAACHDFPLSWDTDSVKF